MDWYSWLSKTNLEPTIVCDYGLAFLRNELQKDDLTYFNHEFLQSIGISVARHRLEILKLARRELKGSIHGFSRLVSAVNRTRKLITRNISKLGSPFPFHTAPDRSLYQNHWSGALKRISIKAKQKQQDQKAIMISSRNMKWSGTTNTTSHHSGSEHLDRKMQERIVYPNWSPMVSRSTDNGQVKERSGYDICKSPTEFRAIDRLGLSPQVNYYRSGKVADRDGVESPWSLMFQDMKPT
ncbi:hypothetical protein OROHE_008375 [Orobanche hederae]